MAVVLRLLILLGAHFFYISPSHSAYLEADLGFRIGKKPGGSTGQGWNGNYGPPQRGISIKERFLSGLVRHKYAERGRGNSERHLKILGVSLFLERKKPQLGWKPSHSGYGGYKQPIHVPEDHGYHLGDPAHEEFSQVSENNGYHSDTPGYEEVSNGPPDYQSDSPGHGEYINVSEDPEHQPESLGHEEVSEVSEDPGYPSGGQGDGETHPVVIIDGNGYQGGTEGDEEYTQISQDPVNHPESESATDPKETPENNGYHLGAPDHPKFAKIPDDFHYRGVQATEKPLKKDYGSSPGIKSHKPIPNKGKGQDFSQGANVKGKYPAPYYGNYIQNNPTAPELQGKKGQQSYGGRDYNQNEVSVIDHNEERNGYFLNSIGPGFSSKLLHHQKNIPASSKMPSFSKKANKPNIRYSQNQKPVKSSSSPPRGQSPQLQGGRSKSSQVQGGRPSPKSVGLPMTQGFFPSRGPPMKTQYSPAIPTKRPAEKVINSTQRSTVVSGSQVSASKPSTTTASSSSTVGSDSNKKTLSLTSN